MEAHAPREFIEQIGDKKGTVWSMKLSECKGRAGSWPFCDSGEYIITASKLRCTPEFGGWIREAKRNKRILPIQYISHFIAWKMHRDNQSAKWRISFNSAGVMASLLGTVFGA